MDGHAEAFGGFIENVTGQWTEGKNRGITHFNKRQVGKKDARTDTKHHRFTQLYPIKTQQVGDNTVLTMGSHLVFKIYLHAQDSI